MSDVMYVTLKGDLPRGFPSNRTLNIPDVPVLLGRLYVETATTSLPPTLTTNGAALVNGTNKPFVRSDAVPVGSNDYSIIVSGQAIEDSDRDGYVNVTDNCTQWANDQLDTGGFDTNLADGRGNACECGDGSQDGEIRDADVMALRQVLAGQTVSQAAKELCSVAGDTICDVKDMMVLTDQLDSPTGSVSQSCARAFPPGRPTDP
jgi:hypothetical protein